MIIKNEHRPTMIKANDRYRGPSEKEKYQNFILEAVHDMNYLGSVLDTNELDENQKGHSDYIENNYDGYMSGNREFFSNLQTATVLYKVNEDVGVSYDLSDKSEWINFNGNETIKSDNGYIIRSNGTLTPTGVRTSLEVTPGDIIYFRMKVKAISGDNKSFGVGSLTVNNNQGDIEKFEIKENDSGIYLDKWLYCKYQETITLDICSQYSPVDLEESSFEISELQIAYFYEEQLGVSPINTAVKDSMNTINSQIQNLKNQ